jgi:tRNA threonylcarbamoyl adenosine modification protein YeaZ
VALVSDGQLLDERHEIVGRGHAEKLVPMIDAVVGRHRPLTVYVDVGPGSFTGVRVGVAAARALALAWQISDRGFSSLALIAAGSEIDAEEFCVAIPGGHGEVFAQRFLTRPLRAIDHPRSLQPDTASEWFGHIQIVGVQSLAEPRLTQFPRAADIIKMPELLRSLPPKPIYLREPDAVRK